MTSRLLQHKKAAGCAGQPAVCVKDAMKAEQERFPPAALSGLSAEPGNCSCVSFLKYFSVGIAAGIVSPGNPAADSSLGHSY
jgi:hypothetical protein